MSRYASGTSVSTEKSRGEIEHTLARFGATGFAYATKDKHAMVRFEAKGRQIMFVLDLPDPSDKAYTHSHRGRHAVHADIAYQKWEQACRQKWRSLALSIKAKLVSVSDGIALFEDEFMANIVMPDGKTVAHHIRPGIDNAYRTGKMPALLPHFGGKP